jgi:glucose-1-phosphate cytidylyltransferase
MKTLILAGGYGSRLSEETDIKPKPMLEIGGRPILWHIMKIYSKYGFNDFVILLGYKGYYIKEYFANYFLHQSDVTFDISNGQMEVHNNSSEPWKVTLLDTGLDSMTGGRVKRAQDFVGDKPFMLTYGDGVANINIQELLKFHKSHGKAMTITSAQPNGRFGALDIDENDKLTQFKEKPKGDGGWINAGFFVCESKVFDYITEGDKTVFEQTPLKNLSKEGEVYTYKHRNFWLPMDTLREKVKLNQMCESGNAPWMTWKK